MGMDKVNGIHHITAIASNPQATYDFYAKVLGLRLVKKSVNQDDVETYHLFFGDRTGDPGMDLTFFTFQPAREGARGWGQVTMISLAVPEGSLKFWERRLKQAGVKTNGRGERFGKQRLVFYDPDNQRLELVETTKEELFPSQSGVWTTGEISKTVAVHHFESARLEVESCLLVEPVVTRLLGYAVQEREREVSLFRSDGKRGVYLEIEERPQDEQGVAGAGTVHHIAFAVQDESSQLALREKVLKLGLYPTEVINRYYFKSVYFRTMAGILFEIATQGPGFTIDEDEAHLGETLALPPFLEAQRDQIEANLSPLER